MCVSASRRRMMSLRTGTAPGETDAEDYREAGSSASRAGPGRLLKGNTARRVEAPAAYICSPTLPTTRFRCCDPLARSSQMPYTTGVRTLVRTSKRRATSRSRAAVSVGGQDGRREGKDDFLDG